MSHHMGKQKHFEALVDLAEGEKRQTYWMGDINECDKCGRSFTSETLMIDALMVPGTGTWGNVCTECATKAGAQIGWGKGQLYRKTEDDKWLLVAGFPPVK